MAVPDNLSLYKSAEGHARVMAHYDAAFAEMGVPFESRYVETGFGATHAVVSGDPEGRKVVLWHGLNANAATWVQWIPALAPSYHVYAVDTIGAMGKSAASRPPKKGPAYGQWAAEALAGLGVERANMVGVSNGAWVIAKLGCVAHERIGSAVLMSAAGFAPVNVGMVLRLMPPLLFKPRAEAARAMLAMLSPPDQPPDPFFLEWFELIMEHFRGEQNVPVLRDEEIRGLVAPSCLLLGQYEASFNPYRALKRGLRLLPNVMVAEMVPGVGHSMVHPRPDWVVARVLRFLDTYGV